MKLITVNVLIVLALLNVGCVTEGELNFKPASDEDQAQANLTLGVNYIQDGHPDLAIPALQRAIDQQPRLAEAHSALGIAYSQTNDFDQAEAEHKRATQLAPSDANVQNAYAVYLCLRNRWKDAEPHYRSALAKLDKDDAVGIMINAGNCAIGGEDLAAAESYYRSVLDIQSTNVDALRGMIDVSIRSRNYLNGRAFFQRLELSKAIGASDLLSCYVIETGLNNASGASDCAERLRREFPGSPLIAQLRNLERNGN